MSQINQKLYNILATCEPVMTADRLQNVKILVRHIKDILRINSEKNMEDVLKGLGLSNLKIISNNNKDITNEFTLTFETDKNTDMRSCKYCGAKLPIDNDDEICYAKPTKPEPEQKFIITYYNLSEFRGYYTGSGVSMFDPHISVAEELTLPEVSEILKTLTETGENNSIFGLLPAPVKEVENLVLINIEDAISFSEYFRNNFDYYDCNSNGSVYKRKGVYSSDNPARNMMPIFQEWQYNNKQ